MFAAFALQACAAPTDDVSSDRTTGANGDESSVTQGDESADTQASFLAGAYGDDSHTRVAGVDASDGAVRADNTTNAKLFIVSRNVSYDLLSFDFSVARGDEVPTGTSEISASKPQLSQLTIVVAPGSPLPSLSKDVFGGKIGDVIVRQKDAASGKFVDVAKFTAATVTSASMSAGGDRPVEQFTLAMRALTVFAGKGWGKIDLVEGTTCSDPCPCETAGGQIGPYVFTQSSTTPIAKEAKRVDSLQVGVRSSLSEPALDGIVVSRTFETSGMCAMIAAGKSKRIPSVHFGVGEASSSLPVESTSWDACYATVQSVSFSSRWDSVGETMIFDAAGLVRSDRTFDGATWSSPTTNGWSFASNTAITSCSEVL
jgi:hypothetical protein